MRIHLQECKIYHLELISSRMPGDDHPALHSTHVQLVSVKYQAPARGHGPDPERRGRCILHWYLTVRGTKE